MKIPKKVKKPSKLILKKPNGFKISARAAGAAVRCVVYIAVVVSLAVLLSMSRARITDAESVDYVLSDAGGQGSDQRTEQMDDFEEKEPEKPKEKQKEQTKTKKNETTNNTPKKSTTSKPSGNNNGNSKSGNGNGKTGKGNGKKGKKDGGTEKPASITVTLDPCGGSCDTRSIKVNTGSEYGSLPAPERNGYTFSGWYTEAENGSAVHSDTKVTATKNHKLYAHWSKVENKVFTVSFDPGEGRMKSKQMKRSMQTGDTFSSLPLPVLTGHNFIGWFTAPEGGDQITEGTTFEGTEDTTFYAQWSYDPYKYWSQTRQTIYESMYACQVVDCYIEFDDHETVTSSGLLEGCKAGNCARNRGNDTTVTDEWVEEKNPNTIIKVVNSSSEASSAMHDMEERFPGRRILIVPYEAVGGSDSERLYYTLYLGQLIYPGWFGDVDLGQAGSELGVNGIIYE